MTENEPVKYPEPLVYSSSIMDQPIWFIEERIMNNLRKLFCCNGFKFDTIKEASDYAEAEFQRTGHVLGIEAINA